MGTPRATSCSYRLNGTGATRGTPARNAPVSVAASLKRSLLRCSIPARCLSCSRTWLSAALASQPLPSNAAPRPVRCARRWQALPQPCRPHPRTRRRAGRIHVRIALRAAGRASSYARGATVRSGSCVCRWRRWLPTAVLPTPLAPRLACETGVRDRRATTVAPSSLEIAAPAASPVASRSPRCAPRSPRSWARIYLLWRMRCPRARATARSIDGIPLPHTQRPTHIVMMMRPPAAFRPQQLDCSGLPSA